MAKESVSASKGNILWVEGRWTSDPNFVPALRKKGIIVEKVSTGKAALKRVEKEEHDVVVVDAASMRTSGKRICQSIRERANGIPILLISDPDRTLGKKEDFVSVSLTLPFTSRKLINRIDPLLPGEVGKTFQAGPVNLDLERKQVRCQGKKTKLTPRLIRLLKMLMDHKGEVVGREKLFKKVWRTEYTGDTRTLDVHISWLRQAIEKDPRKPKLLRTIRGVGYRLDV